ncbi:hypothetical protein CAL7716_085730 [Calothrix sp. PCC 7716]|nr:hypothetical protein CAL7716_085730 [Calothrix sp. PCC 7716]
MVSENGEEKMYVLADAVRTVAWSKELGLKLTAIKNSRGLSFIKIQKATEALGDKSSDAFLVRLAAGEYAEVSLKKLSVICQVLGIEVHEFVPVLSQKTFPSPIDSTNSS